MKKSLNKVLTESQSLRKCLMGITPKEMNKISLFSKYKDYFTVYAPSIKNRHSTVITQKLLDKVVKKAKSLNKVPRLIADIIVPKYTYTLTCEITKTLR